MATRIGTGSTGTTSTAAQNTTGAHCLVAHVKWENAVTLTGLTDTAGNTWVIQQQSSYVGSTDPRFALAYCISVTANAANVVTPSFSGAAAFVRIEVEAFSSSTSSFFFDTAGTPKTGTGNTYSGNSFTTFAAGIVFGGASDFNSLGTTTGGGTPTFTTGNLNGDSFSIFLLSGSAQTVTPGATTTAGATQWIMSALSLTETAPVTDTLMGQACL